MKKHIPNFITVLNLVSGSIGISLAFRGALEMAAIMMGLAAVFDFLDGMAARILHVKSEIGKELDSLADVISFGLLPGVIVMELMKTSYNLPSSGSTLFFNPFLLPALLIPAFSAIRLAKFNLDTRQTESFLGLPTPAAALLLGSFPLILGQEYSLIPLDQVKVWINNYYVLLAFSLILPALLVSEIPLISLKFKNLKFRDNQPRFVLLGFSLLSIALLGFLALPLIIVVYIMISLAYRS